jgi:MarR-like DNA-binding transcriptional regulator SgrR of sgrS sRNA
MLPPDQEPMLEEVVMDDHVDDKWVPLLDAYAEALVERDQAEAALEVAEAAAKAAQLHLGEVEDKLGRQFEESKAAVRIRVKGEL